MEQYSNNRFLRFHGIIDYEKHYHLSAKCAVKVSQSLNICRLNCNTQIKAAIRLKLKHIKEILEMLE